MNMNTQARDAYSNAAAPIRTDRGSEYAIFAKVTHRLTDCDEDDRADYPRVASAVRDNQRLWGALAQDLMHDGNALPIGLRAQLVSLAEFVRKHSLKVLSGKGSVEPLIDINTAIMRGLRGNPELAA